MTTCLSSQNQLKQQPSRFWRVLRPNNLALPFGDAYMKGKLSWHVSEAEWPFSQPVFGLKGFRQTFIISYVLFSFFFLLLVSGSLCSSSCCQVIIQHSVARHPLTTHMCCSCRESQWSVCRLDRWRHRQTTCPPSFRLLPVRLQPRATTCWQRVSDNSWQSSSKVQQT